MDYSKFTKEQVEKALVYSNTFIGACKKLGIVTVTGQKDSALEENIFDAVRNMHELLHHFGLKTTLLGMRTKGWDGRKCPHCGEVINN